uniref:Uncharacterized protein n=1 Tax=Arundo donax TaxID=35708 RepID=A0A0A8YR07_ARUDO
MIWGVASRWSEISSHAVKIILAVRI